MYIFIMFASFFCFFDEAILVNGHKVAVLLSSLIDCSCQYNFVLRLNLLISALLDIITVNDTLIPFVSDR